jgi:regulatory protein
MRAYARGTEKTPARKAFTSALRRLARRDHSEQELRRALADEGQTAADIDDAIARLQTARYIDDRSFAERFTRSRLRTRGHGRGRIRQGLSQRGVAREVVDAAIGGIAADGTETEALDALARKYWRLHGRVEPDLRVRRLYTFLLRRGFPAGLVHQRLRALWPKQGSALSELEEPTDDVE